MSSHPCAVAYLATPGIGVPVPGKSNTAVVAAAVAFYRPYFVIFSSNFLNKLIFREVIFYLKKCILA